MIDKIISEELKVNKNYFTDFRKNVLEDGSILAYQQAPRGRGSPKYRDSSIVDSDQSTERATQPSRLSRNAHDCAN
jgi:hypothetical protein